MMKATIGDKNQSMNKNSVKNRGIVSVKKATLQNNHKNLSLSLYNDKKSVNKRKKKNGKNVIKIYGTILMSK